MIPPLRVLPIVLPPVHQETIGSYLNRLADANRLKLSTLAALLGLSRRWRRDHDEAREWTDQTLARLATLTARASAALIHALPALNDQFMRGGEDPLAVTAVRTGCRRCMARLGIRGLVLRRVPSHENICLRHRCWLAGADHHALDHLPDIVQANLRHRRLARKAGPTAQSAYQQGLTQLIDWSTPATQTCGNAGPNGSTTSTTAPTSIHTTPTATASNSPATPKPSPSPACSPHPTGGTTPTGSARRNDVSACTHLIGVHRAHGL